MKLIPLTLLFRASFLSSSIIKSKTPSKLPRIYYPQTVKVNNDFILDLKTIHYLKCVLRIKPGYQFRCFNPTDGEFLCTWLASDDRLKETKHACVISQLRPPLSANNNLQFALYFAPIKNTRLKDMIESCTELGVRHFIPVVTQNTNSIYNSYENFASRLIESAEQSEQLHIPEIHNQITIKQLLATWPISSNKGNRYDMSPILFVCRERMIDPTTDALPPSFSQTIERTLYPLYRNHIPPSPSSTIATTTTPAVSVDDKTSPTTSQLIPGNISATCGLFIGPEGGFTQDEFTMMSTYSFVKFVSLGSSVLRAETAAVAAVSILTDKLYELSTTKTYTTPRATTAYRKKTLLKASAPPRAATTKTTVLKPNRTHTKPAVISPHTSSKDTSRRVTTGAQQQPTTTDLKEPKQRVSSGILRRWKRPS